MPGDQDAMDKAEILREFVFDAAPTGEALLRDPTGVDVKVQIRLLGFDGQPKLEDFPSAESFEADPATETLTSSLQDLLDAVVKTASTSVYRSASLADLAQGSRRGTIFCQISSNCTLWDFWCSISRDRIFPTSGLPNRLTLGGTSFPPI